MPPPALASHVIHALCEAGFLKKAFRQARELAI
jgi:hypothetical protein